MRFDCDISVHNVNRLLCGLLLFEFCLVLAFVGNVWLGSPNRMMTSLFDLDGEVTIPTWFSSVQLFVIGLVFFYASRRAVPEHAPSLLFLSGVAAVFVFLSADEAASIHETITRTFRHVEWLPRFKGKHGIWVFIYTLIGIALLFASRRQLRAMWKRHRRATTIMTLGLGIFLAGALVLEIISFLFLRGGSTPLLYQAEVALEEFLEMAGASVILYGALRFLLRESPEPPGSRRKSAPNKAN